MADNIITIFINQINKFKLKNSLRIVQGTNITIGTIDDSPNNQKTIVITSQATISPLISGIIVAYGGSSAPADYLLCDGSSVNRTTYATLFSIIGTTYGSVNSSSFNVPDLRQRFPLGKAASGTGSVLGSTGGAIDHKHTINSDGSHNHTGSTGTPSATQMDVVTVGLTPKPTVTHTHTISSDGTHSHGGTTEANNAPFQTVNYLIKI